jgi:outer membrane cobalamin receptor
MRHFNTDRDLKIYSAAFEYEVTPFTDFGIVLGYSKYWFKKDSGEKEDESSVLAGLEYMLFNRTKLHGSYSHKIRFPSVSQLYDETKGNSDLKTEKSNNFELGITQYLPGESRLSLTGFYIKVKDFIKKDDVTQLNSNEDKYRFRGFELSAETRILPRAMLRLCYTYMDSEDRAEHTDFDELQYTPRDKVTIESAYSFPFGLTLYASLLHVNRQYYYSKKAPIIKRKLNEYTLIDVKISQKLFRDKVEYYTGAKNLFDKDYETSYTLPQAGQFFYWGVKCSF